ncbi:MAG: hypothetical protein PUC98_04515 [Clostridiales bacterium]|nr:hypothetical protein [Clostridiales bacterium]
MPEGFNTSRICDRAASDDISEASDTPGASAASDVPEISGEEAPPDISDMSEDAV